MSKSERNEDRRESVEQVNQALWERSDAAWRPFEQRWAGLVATRYDALDAVRRDEFRCGTPAEADAEAKLNDLFREVAREAARVAHTADFESRWGFRVLRHVLGKDHLCVVFNNNPYAGMPTLRDKELEEFRDWLAEMGVDELGYAEHPDLGRGEGYSYALLMWCIDGSESIVEEQYAAIRRRTMARIPWPGGGGTPAGK